MLYNRPSKLARLSALVDKRRLVVVLTVVVALVAIYIFAPMIFQRSEHSEWDKMVETGALNGNPPRMRFSNDFQTIATASLVDGVRVWRASDRRLLDNLGDDSLTPQLEFSRDGRTLAWSHSLSVFFYDMQAGRMVDTPIKAKTWVGAIAISPADYRIVATGSSAVELWSRPLVDAFHHVVADLGHEDAVYTLAFSEDGKLLAAGLSDGTTRIWRLTIVDLPTKDKFEAEQLYSIPDEQGSISALAFSPIGPVVAIGSSEGEIRLVNTGDGTIRQRLSAPGGIFRFAFSPDAQLLAMSHLPWPAKGREQSKVSSQITILRISDGVQLWTSQTTQGVIWDLKFADNGRSFTAGYPDGTVQTQTLP
jgi:WD40 repeat protein